MDINRDMFIAIAISFTTQIIIWFQLNGQLVWKSFRDHPWLLSLLGIPISYAWIMCTKYGYAGFGSLWPIRLLGFATGIISFAFITWFVLGESIDFKTVMSLLLALGILLLQFI
tara:strand:+ start:258 stop:599 length:342 start_codon:yes stop_codon:yes gene_type:complete